MGHPDRFLSPERHEDTFMREILARQSDFYDAHRQGVILGHEGM